jgi:aminopeptidase-like protein
VLAHSAATVTRPAALGIRVQALLERLHPLCPSITGHGVRATLGGVLTGCIPLTVLDRNRHYVYLCAYGKHNWRSRLHESLNKRSHTTQALLVMLWVLNYSDGEQSPARIAERAPGLPFDLRCRGYPRTHGPIEGDSE